MSSTEWHTPRDLVEELQEAVCGFDLDPASGCEPEPIADAGYTKEDDGLSLPWFGKVFVNPPYSRKDNPRWSAKIAEEGQKERVDLIVALVPANVDTAWWHNNYATADHIAILEGRLKFGGAENTGKFANALCVWGDDVPADLLRIMDERGELYDTEAILAPENFYVGDVLEVQVGTQSMGMPDGIDEVAHVRVESGTITDDGLVEIVGVQPRHPRDGPEVYYLLSAPLSDLTDIRCSTAHSTVGWHTVPLTKMVALETRTPVETTVQVPAEGSQGAVATDGGETFVDETRWVDPAPRAVGYHA